MNRLRYEDIKTKETEFLALTSLTVNEFEVLVPHFEKAFQAHMSKWCLDGKARTERSYSTYENCPLPTAEDRLLFVQYLRQLGMKNSVTLNCQNLSAIRFQVML